MAELVNESVDCRMTVPADRGTSAVRDFPAGFRVVQQPAHDELAPVRVGCERKRSVSARYEFIQAGRRVLLAEQEKQLLEISIAGAPAERVEQGEKNMLSVQ